MKNWEKSIRKVVPYVPGEQPQGQVVKLNTNENPYPPSPAVQQAIAKMKAETLRLYPDPKVETLTNELARYHGLQSDQVFVGVGSDDVIALAFLTYFNSDKPILFPDITYSFYDVWADLYRIPYERLSLDDDFEMQLEDYQRPNGGIIFPNPNAPTGIYTPLAKVERILQMNPDVVVIVDEAYIDFGGTSAISLIDNYDNLLVVQTYSKSRSMAGIRIGYAMGNVQLIKYLSDVKHSFNSYTMNQPSLQLGLASLRDEEYYLKVLTKIVTTREWTKQELKKIGFIFPDSKANFIFATHPKYPAKELFQALMAKQIYVRYFDKPRISEYLRITVGTQAEMEKVIGFLQDYCK